MKKIEIALRLVAAGILVQTLFFKFTAAPESVYIFRTVGAEPWGRIGSGVVELTAAILLLLPKTAPWGALLGAGVMVGAISSHLTTLGIDVLGDHGLLFGLAVATFVACSLVVWLRRRDLPLIGTLALFLSFGSTFGQAVAPNADGGVAIHGYDPVSYVDSNRAEVGRPDLLFGYRGASYRFASPEHLEKFKAAPEKYEPAYAGWCAYAMAKGELVDINPESFKVIQGKTHLFYNGFWGDTRAKWNADEAALKAKADAAWKKLDHP